MFSFIERNRQYLINIPLIIYWLILFVLTSLPSSSAITIGISDKIEHFGAYGLLSAVLYMNLFFQKKFELLKKYPATFSVLIASIYGMLDEVHQLFIPGRSAEFLDWSADFLGSLLAILIVKVILERLRQLEYKKFN
ncbi:MAG: VanZ family protein [Ignavibacteriaceae bacterium]